jgi:hypothetical protein
MHVLNWRRLRWFGRGLYGVQRSSHEACRDGRELRRRDHGVGRTAEDAGKTATALVGLYLSRLRVALQLGTGSVLVVPETQRLGLRFLVRTRRRSAARRPGDTWNLETRGRAPQMGLARLRIPKEAPSARSY